MSARWSNWQGHPANATIALYENFVTNLVNMVHDQPDLWNTTVMLLTVDEGGGYYDSGYIQPVDFFGGGTRIPVIAVSPYAKKGFVDHTYYDHASVLKFIERNWASTPSRRVAVTTSQTRYSRRVPTCRLTARQSELVQFRKIPAQRARD
jgi:phospholipase C